MQRERDEREEKKRKDRIENREKRKERKERTERENKDNKEAREEMYTTINLVLSIYWYTFSNQQLSNFTMSLATCHMKWCATICMQKIVINCTQTRLKLPFVANIKAEGICVITYCVHSKLP